MEGLIRLVAECFLRHGLEVEPADGSLSSEPSPKLAEAALPQALPEHNYGKSSILDRAP
jgi:hypothetical protein